MTTIDRARVLAGHQCHYCGSDTVLVDSAVVYRGVSHGLIWKCPGECDAYVGVHDGSEKAKGSVANLMLRNMRKRAHAAFDPIWKEGMMERNAAYAELSKHMQLPVEETHVGMFSGEQCQKATQWANVITALHLQKQKSNEDMETITATVLSITESQLAPAKAPGTKGIQWWAMRMSDRPDYDLFIASTEGEKLPFVVGQGLGFTEGKTGGGKPKLIPQLAQQPAREHTKPASAGGVSPQLQQPPVAQTAPAQAAPTTVAAPPAAEKPAPASTTGVSSPNAPPKEEPMATAQKPDNEVRHSVVKSVKFVESFKDGSRHKYAVAMDNGEDGFMYPVQREYPVKIGDPISYSMRTTTSGKTIVPTLIGALVDNQTIIMREACLNSTIAYHTSQGTKLTIEQLLADSIIVEQHITRK